MELLEHARVTSIVSYDMPSFQIVSLSLQPFAPLSSLSSKRLSHQGAVRVKASSNPGYPCRISLVDAELDEELLLLPFEHHPESSPYRSSGPTYVRAGATQRTFNAGQIQEYVRLLRFLLRAYDDSHMVVAVEVCVGAEVEVEIELHFGNLLISYIHLHNAKRKCFACLVGCAPEPSCAT